MRSNTCHNTCGHTIRGATRHHTHLPHVFALLSRLSCEACMHCAVRASVRVWEDGIVGRQYHVKQLGSGAPVFMDVLERPTDSTGANRDPQKQRASGSRLFHEKRHCWSTPRCAPPHPQPHSEMHRSPPWLLRALAHPSAAAVTTARLPHRAVPGSKHVRAQPRDDVVLVPEAVVFADRHHRDVVAVRHHTAHLHVALQCESLSLS